MTEKERERKREREIERKGGENKSIINLA